MTSATTVAAVVLAAGVGRRFGAAKQLAYLDGRPLVRHAVDAALAGGCGPVVVVLGHAVDRVRAVLPKDVCVVVNDMFATGQASSLKAGVAAVAATDATGLVVLLADQPYVDPAVVRAVAGALAVGHPVVRARYQDRSGHPVGFASETFDGLARIRGDVGARDLLEELGVVDLVVESSCPVDVDTPDDLDLIRRRNPGHSSRPV